MSNYLIITSLLLWVSHEIHTQELRPLERYRIGFYNVENYFDPFADTTTDYNEYTPEGNRRWSVKKYHSKRSKIYKSIAAMGEMDGLTLIGLAEIENAFVIEDLIKATPLSRSPYKYVHFESNDHRGIDVGLIYHSERFTVVYSEKLTIRDDHGEFIASRDILYVCGLLGTDSLHVFVNHWTSRYRGVLESVHLRKLAAHTLIRVLDSICEHNKQASILIMGDFNDEPKDQSIRMMTEEPTLCKLRLLPANARRKDVDGSLKYQGDWFLFDHMLVSEGLKSHKNLILDTVTYIFSPSFLLVEDKKYLGVKPRRNFYGFEYLDGFSDHLPIFVDIYTTQ